MYVGSLYRMVVHAMELLTASSDNFGILLHEERYNLGGISIEELHRLGYAQVLSSHPLTWQVSSFIWLLISGITTLARNSLP